MMDKCMWPLTSGDEIVLLILHTSLCCGTHVNTTFHWNISVINGCLTVALCRSI